MNISNGKSFISSFSKSVVPVFFLQLQALAKVIMFIMADVPASNLPGALAQTTQSGAIIVVVPPPSWSGLPRGSLPFPIAIALTRSGRLRSLLEIILYQPCFSLVASMAALRGVQKITVYLL